MVCERVLGTIHKDADRFSFPPRRQDIVDLHWWELDRRALRKTTHGGRGIRIVLALGESLADGAILHDDGSTLIVCKVLPCEVLVVFPENLTQMGRIALALGNLHAPSQITATEILAAPDGPVEAALNELGVPFERQVRCFTPQRCAGMPMVRVGEDLKVSR